MWKISKKTGQIYKNGVLVDQDDFDDNYKEFLIAFKNGDYELIENTLEEIQKDKEKEIEEIKKIQYQELLPTDWYYTRFLDTGQEVPLEIKQLRQEIRNKYNTLIENLSLNL